MNEINVLKTIQGLAPFDYDKVIRIRDPTTNKVIRKEIQRMHRVPLKELHITQEMLEGSIESCIENEGELGDYDEDRECEIPIYFDRNYDVAQIWAKVEPLLDVERIQEMDSQSEVGEYLDDLLWDNCLELLPKESREEPESNPNYIDPCKGCPGEDCCCCNFGKGY